MVLKLTSWQAKLFLLIHIPCSVAFTSHKHTRQSFLLHHRNNERTTHSRLSAAGASPSFDNHNQDDNQFWTSLRDRTTALIAQEKTVTERWRFAKCKCSEIKFNKNDDDIRRIDMDQYPLVACGSKDGSLYVANLESGQIVAAEIGFHRRFGGDEDAMKLVHGEFDGGGVLAVVMRGDILVSAGREGGAKVWRIKNDDSGELLFMGDIVALHRQTVTCLQFDQDGKLWAGTYNGNVYAFDHENAADATPLSVQTPSQSMDMGSPVMSLSIAEELGCGVCATSQGGVKFFWLEQSAKPEVFASWYPFASEDDEASNAHAHSAVIIQNNQQQDSSSTSNADTAVHNSASWSVVCGAKDGTIYSQTLNVDSFGSMCADDPFHGTPAKSSSDTPDECHTAPVICLTPVSSSGGLLVSGSQDGTMRVWDWTSTDKSTDSENNIDETNNDLQCLYAFSHKGYLGNILCDGLRLVSDGRDDAVMVHDFTAEEHDRDGKEAWTSWNSKGQENNMKGGWYDDDEEESVWE